MSVNLLNIEIRELELENNICSPEGKIKLDIEVEKQIEKIDLHHCIFYMRCNVSGNNDDDFLDFNMVVAGHVESDTEIIEEQVKNDTQVVNEMFAYLKTYVSTITTLANMPTITLPMMNDFEVN